MRLVVRDGLGLRLAQDRAARVAAGSTSGSLNLGADGTGSALACRAMKLGAMVMAVAALGFAGCGGSAAGDRMTTAATAPVGPEPTAGGTRTAAGATATATEEAGSPAETEASPESPAKGPASTGNLPDADRSAVTASVTAYIAALDRHDAARVCNLIAPGGLDLQDLPKRRGGCRTSLRASIGTRPADGGPAWQRTDLVEIKPEALGDDRARVTATVTHHFSDRKYVSVEDDVIYLERVGGRWLIAKPSATLYRAVGYPQPPLRAFGPPPGW
jgi:hypothetical protein